MTVAVFITTSARKEVDGLPATVQARVAAKIVELARYPTVSNIKALKGSLKGQHRARIGDYRIIFTVSGETLTITASSSVAAPTTEAHHANRDPDH